MGAACGMIEVRSSRIHGRGVFASQAIEEGQVFHKAHLLVFPSAQYPALQDTVAAHYVFHVAEAADGSPNTVNGLAMSPISFINHSRAASCAFEVDPDSQTIRFTALRPIDAGEELTIDYGDFAERSGISD